MQQIFSAKNVSDPSRSQNDEEALDSAGSLQNDLPVDQNNKGTLEKTTKVAAMFKDIVDCNVQTEAPKRSLDNVRKEYRAVMRTVSNDYNETETNPEEHTEEHLPLSDQSAQMDDRSAPQRREDAESFDELSFSSADFDPGDTVPSRGVIEDHDDLKLEQGGELTTYLLDAKVKEKDTQDCSNTELTVPISLDSESSSFRDEEKRSRELSSASDSCMSAQFRKIPSRQELGYE